MLEIPSRLYFCILLIFCIVNFSDAGGQDVDSLDLAIDGILKKGFSARNDGKKDFEIDSLNILRYLSKGSGLRTINSDSSLFYVRKAVNLSLRSKSLRLISLATQDLGGYYLSHEMYRQAMTCYLSCLRIEEKRNDTKRMADLYDDLGSVYYYMEVFDKSLDYYQKALDIYSSYKDTMGIAGSMSHLGTLHSSREFCEKRNDEQKRSDYKTALDYYEKAITQFEHAGDKRGIAKSNQNIAAVYNKMNKPETALGYAQTALDFYREINEPEGISGTLYTIGKTYYRLKDYPKSIQAYKESEEIALRGNLTGGIQYLYEAMAMPYYDSKDYKNAYDYYIKYMTLRDSVYNSEKSKQIIELETRYQSQVKQNEILRLTSEKRKKNNLLYLLSGVIVLLGSSIYYFVRLVRKNKIISEQNNQISERKIRELEKERMYLAAKSVMEGEEAERSRLAGDLHNGLGGLLSGVKINLSQMKENAVITHENVSAFNHVISLLDTSISELRRIAHNLMPETLNHYGLKTALEDFCTQVAPAGQPRIVLQFFGDEIRFTKELELSMYRIIQELVNNSLKHAGATLINIQVFSEPKRLFAQVTDNGKGFDSKTDIKTVSGKGLVNIRDRVTALNGKLDIWSQPGQGTEIGIEIVIS